MKSNKFPTIFIVVPLYNEEKNIERFLFSISTFREEVKNAYKVQVVLIDDGSQDRTAELARKSSKNIQLTVLTHKSNLGPGKAFGTAFSYLSNELMRDDLVLTMEGDNTSRYELIGQMLHRLEEGFDAVFASPYLYGGRIENTSFLRVFLSSMANLFVKELLGVRGILTVSSFFRLYRASFLKKLQLVYGPEIIERTGFECMTEVTMKMVNMQATISEVAMVLDTAARVGKSRMNMARTVLGYFSLFLHKTKWENLAQHVE